MKMDNSLYMPALRNRNRYIPFESAEGNHPQLQKMDEGEEEQFLTYEKDGELTVRCICEQCEQSLRTISGLLYT